MAQVLLTNSNATIASGTTRYMGLMGFHAAYLTTDAAAYQIVPTAGVIKFLNVRAGGSVGTPGTAVTLMLNGSPTALTCTFINTAVGQDLTHSVSVVAGDKVSLQFVVSSGTARAYSATMVFVPDVLGETIMMGNSKNTAPTANQFVSIANVVAPNTDALVRSIIPEAGGLFKNFYVAVDTDPTVSSTAVIFTVFNNGSAGNNTITINNGSTSGNDTSHTDVIATAADPASIKVTVTGSPTLSAFHWGITYISPNYNFLIFAGRDAAIATAGSNYSTGFGQGVETGSLGFNGITNAFLAKELWVKLSVAPGGTSSWDIVFRDNAADTALIVNIAGTATAGNLASNATVALGDLIDFQMRVNTPTPSILAVPKFALIGYLADPQRGNYFPAC